MCLHVRVYTGRWVNGMCVLGTSRGGTLSSGREGSIGPSCER